MLVIADALIHAEERIQQAGFSDSSRLDAEILLSFVTGKNRSYFIAFSEQALSAEHLQQFQCLLDFAVTGKPIAYITGSKEFWSMNFKVTEDTLIPRPDTETLVEKVLERYSSEKSRTLIDLGTGSGAIAIALKKELPRWQVYACDNSEAALSVAKENSFELGVEVKFRQSNWLDAFIDIEADVIVSNPPYIVENDSHLENLSFEPITALVASEHGLSDIKKIVQQAKVSLKPGGSLWLEHGFEQAELVREVFQRADFLAVVTYKDLSGNDRITAGFKHE